MSMKGQRQFGRQRRGINNIAGPGPQQPKMEIPPEQALHIRALTRLEMTPPYQSVMPYEMVLQNADGQAQTRQFKGLTKREHICTALLAGQVEKNGLPVDDVTCLHYARLAVMLSEHLLQTLSKVRGTDMDDMKKQMADEDADARAKAFETPRVGDIRTTTSDAGAHGPVTAIKTELP